ncbi:hypothetical protein HKCCE2091_17175 [Rhodobacterales bacterium HKCCE2091]|nr:hypothetical protein [Rhodobacterales bacterium HKCCE2091]
MRHLALTTAICLAAAAPAGAARYQFCWIGASGYTMEGVIEFPDELIGTGIITEEDITDFAIYGFLDEILIGAWSMKDVTPDTTWELYFDTDTLEFPTGGYSLDMSYQAWNANGEVNDCGPGGFGFNGGNLYQDVCVDNTWIQDSSIEPSTPFPVFPQGVQARCANAVPIS